MQRPSVLPRTLPEAHRASVGRRKTRDYLLDPDHPEGGPKARVFQAMLGYSRSDWELLRRDLEEAADRGRVTGWRLNPDNSASWSVTVTLTGPNGRSCDVQTRWRVAVIGNVPRLTTAWIDLGG